MEFKRKRLTNYDENSIILEICRVANKLDVKPLTIAAYSQIGKVKYSTIRRRFGNWENALRTAGLGEEFISSQHKKYSKTEIIAELKRVAEILGKTSFTAHEFGRNSKINRSSKSIFKHFKNFKNAMIEAGLEVPSLSKRYTEEERFENLLNVWTYYGRQPNYSEMKKHPSIVGPKAYVSKWGKWSLALDAFVKQVRNDNKTVIEVDEKQVINKAKKKNKFISSEDSRKIKLGVRYAILSRDSFKCVRCGNSPATDPTCKLHVDHIIPFSKGGETILENLQTLCLKCNIGKGNKYEE